VLRMRNKQEIILSHFRDGESKSEISRRLGISRGTVRKYIEDYSREKTKLIKADGSACSEIIESLVEAPRYDSSSRTKRKLTNAIVDRVKGYLDENRKKRSRGQHKQQMKKIDIHEALVQAGYDIGYSSICHLVTALEGHGRESFIRQEYEHGQVCEFDWGEVKLFLDGKLRRLQLAVFTSAKGNYRYARLFVKQDTPSFQQSHGLFFAHIGGVYREMVYDNMSVAVKRFTGHREKEATQGLLSLSAYYLFRFRFCNVCRGNEKGHVEKSVEYVRRKAFAVEDTFPGIDAANTHLVAVCEKLNERPRPSLAHKRSSEILREEREYLLPLPPMFECGEFRECRVDKYSTICIDTCRYSVPESSVERLIMAKVYPERIVCYDNDTRVCEHLRRYGFHEWSIELDHYLLNFTRKPGALAGSVALRQSEGAVRALYTQYYRKHPREFIEVLFYLKESGKEIREITAAIEKLEGLGGFDHNLDKIRIVCERRVEQGVEVKRGEIEEISLRQLTLLAGLIPDNTTLEMEVIL